MAEPRNRSRSPIASRTNTDEEVEGWEKKIDAIKHLKYSILGAEVKKANVKLEPYDDVVSLYSVLKTMKPGEPLSNEAFEELRNTTNNIATRLVSKAIEYDALLTMIPDTHKSA